MKFNYTMSERTAKERIQLLVRKYRNDELNVRVGTEDERAERINLMATVISIMESEIHTYPNNGMLASGEEVPDELRLIARSVGIEEWQDSSTSNQSTPRDSSEFYYAPSTSTGQRRKPAKDPNVSLVAMSPDTSVNESVNNALYHNYAAEESGKLYKRGIPEYMDDLLKRKYEHDMEMEKKRFKLEEEKLLMEKRRLEIEAQRETRLAEDSRRNGEILQTLLQLIKEKQTVG